ncbi:MAG: FtsX-like permease family protein [Thermoplasmata archaeon]|nr:FtsX-like permease family protein [Thermoplasmata archaeon]
MSKGKNVESTQKSKSTRFNVFEYIYMNFRHNKLRYGLTITGLSVCVVFFIIVASLSMGLYEKIEYKPSGENTTPEETEEIEALELDNELKKTLVNWLYSVSVILFATAVAGVSNTMVMAMQERRREIGILKAVGITKKQIIKLFVIESLWLSFIAWIIGWVIGAHLANNIFGILHNQDPNGIFFAPMLTTPVIIFTAFLLVFVVGTLSAVYPAKKAAELEPVVAMKI